MNTNTTKENRFDDPSRYAAFLESPEGRLRLELTLANLQELLPMSKDRPLRALDLGCGTGAAALRLAQLGVQVTLVDSSQGMLDLAERAIAEAGVNATVKRCDATKVSDMFPAESFDVVLCHNVLEYVDDPGSVLRGVVRVMRGSSALLSVLVRNQAGEVLKEAIRAGDLTAAERTLDEEWGQESLYGGKVRLFTPESLETMFKNASLDIAARRGVRVVSDYLPSSISRTEQYERIFELERKLARRPEFYGVARYLQCLAISGGNK